MYCARGRKSSNKFPHNSLQSTAQMSHSSPSCPESPDNQELWDLWWELTVQLWTLWSQQVNPRHVSLTDNQCLRFFLNPAYFPVAFLQLESCYLLLQDCLALPMLLVRIVSYKTISHVLGLNEVQRENIGISIKIRLERKMRFVYK